MKKFAKVMLISTGILAVIGIALCAAGYFIGSSFKELFYDRYVRSEYYEIVEEDFDDIVEGVLSGDNTDEVLEDAFKDQPYDEFFSIDAAEVSELYLGVGGGVVTFVSGEENQIVFFVNSEYADLVELSQEDEQVELEVNRKRLHLTGDTPIITIQVPKSFVWEELEIELKAGQLIAQELLAEDGAIIVKAGKADLGSLEVTNLELEIQAGAMELNYLEFADGDITCDAGSLAISNGLMSGEADISCNAGAIRASFHGDPEEYTYKVMTSVGRILLNGQEYTGISGNKIKGTGNGVFDISCNVGAIELDVSEDEQSTEMLEQEWDIPVDEIKTF